MTQVSYNDIAQWYDQFLLNQHRTVFSSNSKWHATPLLDFWLSLINTIRTSSSKRNQLRHDSTESLGSCLGDYSRY
jgi:hypothetical protein